MNISIINYEASPLICKALINMNYTVITSTCISNIPEPISYHPDIQLHVLDHNTIISAPECYDYYKINLPYNINILKGNSKLDGTYPNDCAYNVARIGDFILCNTHYVDSVLLDYYKKTNKNIIHVNQGYSKCNICIIDDSTIITEDKGIHNTIIDNSLPIKSHLLPPGNVLLKGYNYGFIGGASGKIENNILFYGDITKTPYYKTIKKISEKQNVNIVSLSNEPLEDFGSIICLSK